MDRGKNLLAKAACTIEDTIRLIEENEAKVVLVVDGDNRLLGTVTDGDVRRGLLRGLGMADAVSEIMNAHPTTAPQGSSRARLFALMKQKYLRHIPLVDEAGRVAGLEFLDDLLHQAERDNWVVIMAGGQGKRLQPLTDDTPKPMLEVGSKPILETILEELIEGGFHRFFLAVNYKSEMVKNHFGDGSAMGAEIVYLEESEPLGTGGALSLLPERPDKTLVVMNGDILTKVRLKNVLDFHADHNADATMCVREYVHEVPFGVVETQEHRLVGLTEKPTQRFLVNAGIYALEPEVLSLVPHNRFFDMPQLFDKLVLENRHTIVFPIREYWLDVGRMEEFSQAHDEYRGIFKDKSR